MSPILMSTLPSPKESILTEVAGPEPTEIIAAVVCRDEQARYMVVPSEPEADTNWELPTGLVQVTGDLEPLDSDAVFSLGGCDIEIVGEGPIDEIEVDPGGVIYTFLGRLVGEDSPLAPDEARWLYPTAFRKLFVNGDVSDATMRGVDHADVRMSW